MRIEIPDTIKQRPNVQVAPLIDIIFITLVFFMTLLVFQQLETELSISVPKAEESKDMTRSPGEIIINIERKGQFVVNQRRLDVPELEAMLKRIASLYPNQPVIIRADKKTYHESVIKALNACASAEIWNISFATTKED